MMAVVGMIRKLAEDEHIILIVTHDMEFLNCVYARTVILTLAAAERRYKVHAER